MVGLRSGDPPESGRFVGEIPVPTEVSNYPESADMGVIGMFDLYGMKMPKHSRVRRAIRLTREETKPYSCKIAGLGVLYVGEEGWEVREN